MMKISTYDEFLDRGGNEYEIKYRLHPIDVGFSLKRGYTVLVDKEDDPIVVSFEGDDGDLWVAEGSQDEVLKFLRRKYKIRFKVQ